MNKFMSEFEVGNNKDYKVKAIQDSIVYGKEVDGHLLILYYLVAWKSYSKKENTWKPASVIMHLQKVINIFYKNYLEKLKTISVLLDSALPIAKLAIKLPIKCKQRRLINNTTKHVK